MALCGYWQKGTEIIWILVPCLLQSYTLTSCTNYIANEARSHFSFLATKRTHGLEDEEHQNEEFDCITYRVCRLFSPKNDPLESWSISFSSKDLSKQNTCSFNQEWYEIYVAGYDDYNIWSFVWGASWIIRLKICYVM